MPEYCMPSPSAPTVADKITLDTSQESATQALYRAAIGPLNSDYYLPIFGGFESTSKLALRWNTAASLYTLNWLVFRRLWTAALVYSSAVLGGILVVFGLGHLIFQFSTEVGVALGLLMLMLSCVVPGLLGNTWLHTDCRRKMAQALSQSSTLQEACGTLRAQSSSRNRFLGVVSVNLILISVGLGLYWKLKGAAEINAIPPRPVTELQPLPKPLPLIDLTSTEPMAAVIQTASEPLQPPSPESAPEPELPLPVSAPLSTPTPTPTLTPSPAQEAKPIAAKTSNLPTYYVNVGLFANAVNAEKVHQRLDNAGMAVTTEVLALPKGKRSRVRVGPFPNRSTADDAVITVKALGLDAIVSSQ